MNLSIVILFTDKDWQDAYNYYKYFKPNGKYEYIFVDNCIEENHKFEDKQDIKYVIANGISIIAARKLALDYCDGEFVWYVDADDNAMNMDRLSSIDFESDCTVFRYDTIENLYSKMTRRTPARQFVFDAGGLWNKIIRKSVLKTVYDKIPDFKYQTFEDTIVTQLIKLFGFTISFNEMKIYNYYQYKSHAGSDPIKYYTDIKEIFDQTYYIDAPYEISRKLRKKLFDQLWSGAEYYVINYYNGDYSKFDIIHTIVDRQTVKGLRTNLALREWLLKNGEFKLLDNQYDIW